MDVMVLFCDNKLVNYSVALKKRVAHRDDCSLSLGILEQRVCNMDFPRSIRRTSMRPKSSLIVIMEGQQGSKVKMWYQEEKT